MAIKSLGYLGVNSGLKDDWQQFACEVMGLQDVSDQLATGEGELYFKMDDHLFVCLCSRVQKKG